MNKPTAFNTNVPRTSNNNTPVLINSTHHNNNVNAFIAPSPQSSHSPLFAATFNNQFNDAPTLLATSNPSAVRPPSTDFFDAFHDQFNKNTNGTTSKANADPFGVVFNDNAQFNNSSAAPFSAKFPDNLFEDEFAKVTINNDDPKPSSTAEFASFDAFNDHSTSASANFADFEDSFSTAFTTTPKQQEAKPNGAAGTIPKDKNANADALPFKKARYAADYSQGESFSKDLDEVLKRSLVDQ